ncbi:hypothetical protein ACH47B_26625 [Rhodococcus sp. NPDC019627]|uniref:hypothetical protein n=1 Tax=unclassified Rhodococcus (in: high G+C Gram-positive bacteria) TaxID=192944 RepID=UPI0033D13BAF
MIPTPPTGFEHLHGFDFNYDFWFECGCGQRIQVLAPAYELQCEGSEPYPVCGCGTAIDISEASPSVRNLSDVDHDDGQVDQHVWYHSSTCQDWPSWDAYRRDIAAGLKTSLLEPEKHAEAIDERCSLALHLGTYAAAVENVMRRMADEDSLDHEYWLHQVEIRLRPEELFPGVNGELSGMFGAVSAAELARRGALAVRYVNTHEAAGSISLAIDPQVITRVRTIQLSAAPAAPLATKAGEQAVILATEKLATAEQLRPDITGVPEDQIFDSESTVFLEEATGRAVSDSARKYAQQMERYRDRRAEIWSSLEGALVDAYLTDVNPQMRKRLTRVIPNNTETEKYHERFRMMAGLLVQPRIVVEQFETALWRTPEPPTQIVQPSE